MNLSIIRSDRPRFTPAELLIVIGILALLAALLLPTLHQSREKALASRCLSHTRQLGQGFELYAGDAGFRMPVYGTYAMSGPALLWAGERDGQSRLNLRRGLMAPYLSGGLDVLLCPGWNDPEGRALEHSALPEGGGYGYSAYGVGSLRYWMEDHSQEKHRGAGWKAGAGRNPSGTVALADAVNAGGSGGGQVFLYAHLPVQAGVLGVTGKHNDNMQFRHRNRASVLWLDGHSSLERMGYVKGNQDLNWNIANRVGNIGTRDNTLYHPW